VPLEQAPSQSAQAAKRRRRRKATPMASG